MPSQNKKPSPAPIPPPPPPAVAAAKPASAPSPQAKSEPAPPAKLRAIKAMKKRDSKMKTNEKQNGKDVDILTSTRMSKTD